MTSGHPLVSTPDADTACDGSWRLADGTSAIAKQLAPRLIRPELVGDLCYRGVHLQASVLDAGVPGDSAGPSRDYRFCVLRPVVWPARLVPVRRRLPREWRSDGVLVCADRRGDRFAPLADLKVEFAARSLLRAVERCIDQAHRQAGNAGHGATRRATGASDGRTGPTSEPLALRPKAGAASLAFTWPRVDAARPPAAPAACDAESVRPALTSAPTGRAARRSRPRARAQRRRRPLPILQDKQGTAGPLDVL